MNFTLWAQRSKDVLITCLKIFDRFENVFEMSFECSMSTGCIYYSDIPQIETFTNTSDGIEIRQNTYI